MNDMVTNTTPTKEELAFILGTFLDRRPGAINIRGTEIAQFEEGFGLNTTIYKLHIDYGAQHTANVPTTILVKQYKPYLVGITSSNRQSKTVYLRELSFYKFANANLSALGNNARLFPTCYNAGLESEINPREVIEALECLKERRVLLLELLGDNLDTRISTIRKQYYDLKRRITNLDSKIGKANRHEVLTLEHKASELEIELKSITHRTLATTKHFHVELMRSQQQNGERSLLPKNPLGRGRISHKFSGYNRILSITTFDRDKRKKLAALYQPIEDVITGRDERSQGLVGIIHADLHHGNIILGERDQIRFTDAANIITDGATLAFDIAPQLFNPPVISFDPERIEDLIGNYYDPKATDDLLREITLATLLAGHNWCFKAAAANITAKKRNLVQYETFISSHEHHEHAVEDYLALSNRILSFILDKSKYFKLTKELSKTIETLKQAEQRLHSDTILKGASTLIS